jgi:hypothetical protein
MKFYESHFEEYIDSVEKFNLHPELLEYYNRFPENICDFENLIVYGGSGIGKYSQVLYFLKKYSPSNLKYEKKITITNEKQTYMYHISDIHYEIDMSFLGCNSKTLWHDIFFHIVDIISIKKTKIGIIVCKNFHMIHSELLEIFYSYIQQYNNPQSNIQIKFVLITEHISFIPNQILNVCEIINIKRPTIEMYKKIFDAQKECKNSKNDSIKQILSKSEPETILNIKEINSFHLLNDEITMPIDIFNTICNAIIYEIDNHINIDFLKFRDILYDILIYNLDVIECIWYILEHYIRKNEIKAKNISEIMINVYPFLKYYNNNYRPIYHLESIMFYIITKIHEYPSSHDNQQGI